mmetsp:Transcript_27763/g.41045  ORF Transcript_27763/g.41045 Transcript_27763/m.41045 type:complete len:1335 (-) Transcript_27763:104-4108(-)|eukprot:CAMPEP_0195527970 /NCGR_PEP_ID=MMETSP0794_2-20130614/29917_1 /TAXON_ID=515487 /ORGANISM="Stephanopyxis turris, Strain CCMP 815" /LENGTH=1334 /DNA_ID=CAMNT_0040658999 /DNA_START=82 /DNA_END=4086 /DNA_ORIENTATION=+
MKFKHLLAVAVLRTSSSFIHGEGRNLVESDEVIDVAVIGGGLSGIYSAWRLLTANETIRSDISHVSHNDSLSVSLFEFSERIGGRLLSVSPPNDKEGFNAEFGKMNFLDDHVLTEEILNYLDIPSKNFPANDDHNICYSRNQHIREYEIRQDNHLPYDVNWSNEGKGPLEILRDAIETIVPGFSSFSSSQWHEAKENRTFDGEYLYNQGLWNVLSRVMSSEAYELSMSCLGMDSSLSNWNAAEGIHSLAKHSAVDIDIKYKTPVDGMETIPVKIRDLFLKEGGTIHYNHKMTHFTRHYVNLSSNSTLITQTAGISSTIRADTGATTPIYKIQFDGRPAVFARSIILALPRRSLELIEQNNEFFQNETVRSLISTVTPSSYSKLFLCYDHAWWTKVSQVGKNGGRSFTDLPLQQTYYFGSCLMGTYSDGESDGFWESMEPTSRKSQPLRFTDRNDNKGASDRWEQLFASPQMISQAQRQLKDFHGLQYIPEPKSAGYISWDHEPFGGAGHLWNVGVKAWEVQKAIMKPLPDWSVHIVGGAYSSEQHFVEGDLESAEKMLKAHFFEEDAGDSWVPFGSSLFSQNDSERFGTAVSISGSGTRAAVGSVVEDEDGIYHKHVSVFDYFGSHDFGYWTQIGFDLEKGSYMDTSSYSVSLSEDGNCLAIGSLGLDTMGNFTGHVTVFQYEDGHWTKMGDVGEDLMIGNELDGSLPMSLSKNESSLPVSLSESGTRLAVGTPLHANGTGQVLVFEYDDGDWAQAGNAIDGIVNEGHFGWSVSLSRNGEIVAAGGPMTSGNVSGYVSVFSFDGDWSRMGSNIHGSEIDDMFGYAVSLSGDGDYVAVGAPSSDVGGVDNGYVGVYKYVEGDWTDHGFGVYGEDGENAGYSISLAADGNVLVVGMPGNGTVNGTSTGRVKVYDLLPDSMARSFAWEQLGSDLTGNSPGDNVGYSVSSSSDGHFVTIGNPTVDSYLPGHIQTYEYIPKTPEAPKEFVMVKKELLTTFDENNKAYGNMFTVRALSDITMTAMDIHTSSVDMISVEVWTKTGSFAGSEDNSTDWTLIVKEEKLQGYGLLAQTPIPEGMFQAVNIKAGESQSFFVTLYSEDLRYTNADDDEMGTVFVSNEELEFFVGAAFGIPEGDAIPFGGQEFENRIFNGVLHYSALGTEETLPSVTESKELRTIFDGVTGSYGAMFNIKALKEIEIRSIDFHTNALKEVNVTVWTKSGSYEGHEQNATHWTLVAEVDLLVGQGMGKPTEIPTETFSPVTVKAGRYQAFYVVLDSNNLEYSRNGNFTNNSVYTSNNDMEFFVGVGISELFGAVFEDSIFNGVVRYMVNETDPEAIGV